MGRPNFMETFIHAKTEKTSKRTFSLFHMDPIYKISFFTMPVPTALIPTWQAMLHGRST